MKHYVKIACTFLMIWKTAECSIADKIVSFAKSQIGLSNYTYPTADKSGFFITLLIIRVGLSKPRTTFLAPESTGYISAQQWADPRPKTHCYVSCTGHPAVPGDFLAEHSHVAVVTGPHVTTGPELIGSHTGVVKETDWGFRSGQHPTCWRYSTEGYCAHLTPHTSIFG